MENLNAEFAAFLKSPAAQANPVDRGDWRVTLAQNADRNGDVAADLNPDTSLTSSIYDPTEDDADDDPFGAF